MDDSRCESVAGRDGIRGVIHRTPQNDQAVAGRVRLFTQNPSSLSAIQRWKLLLHQSRHDIFQ